ncbi:MAG: hypothetical protein AAB227_02105 [Pseudomonadota bacterium]
MKNKPKRAATPDVQPKTRRRARVDAKRQKNRSAGHSLGVDFFMALFNQRRGVAVSEKPKIGARSSRADIRKVAARGDLLDAPFAVEDETRQSFTRAKRQRRQRAILAQHARRFGLHELPAKKFSGRCGD